MTFRASTGLVNKLGGIKTNLVTNGAFGTNTNGWTGDGANLAANAGVLEITNSGSAAGKGYVDIATRVGRIYKATFEVDIGTGTTVKVLVGTTDDDDAILSSPSYSDTSLTEKSLVFIATATTTRLTFVNESTTSAHLIQVDNVVVDDILDGFAEIMRGAKINIYTGSQPATADTAASGTLLATFGTNLDTGDASVDGVTWDPASDGVVNKPSSETWTAKAVAAGNAGWFRVFEDGDDPSGSSATAARIDGSIAVSGGEMSVTSVAIALDSIQTIAAFSYTIPKS